jgi:hypothetical protein
MPGNNLLEPQDSYLRDEDDRQNLCNFVLKDGFNGKIVPTEVFKYLKEIYGAYGEPTL